MKHKKSGLKKVVILLVVAVMLIIIGKTTISYALIDETNSVHIDASEIEDATLIIGTHLIYLGSMNEQIYAIAMKSAEESSQYNRYYKSEIAGGTWYEITEAGSLADITTDGIVVEDKVIEELFMTHHTKSDGVTYDLTNKKAVGIFDINDPYDLSEMEELNPIKLQYDMLVQTEEPSDTMKRDILYIKEIYQFERQTDKTKEIDRQMKELQTYYNILVRDGAEEAMCDKVMSAIEKLDAARRVEVLGPLNDYQLSKMNQVVGREFTYLKGEITGVYTIAEEREKKAEEAKEEVYSNIEKQKGLLNEKKNEINQILSEAVEAAFEKAVQKVREDRADELAGLSGNDLVLKKAEIEDAAQKAGQEAEKKALNEKKTELKQEIAELDELEITVESLQTSAKKDALNAEEEAMNAKRDVVENFVVNTDLLTAVSEAMTNVQESYYNYRSKMLSEGTSVLSKAEFRLTEELISNAQNKNYGACDIAVMKLIYLDRIHNSIIREEADERRFIAVDLLEDAENNYSSSLAEGVGDSYKTLSSMAAASTKANVLKTQLSETEVVRNELQFIIQAYIDRMAPEEAMDDISRRIDKIDSLRSYVKQDAFKEYANTSVDNYLEWLTQALKNIQNLSGGSNLDNLNLQKDELQTKLLAALDDNRLDKAKKIETQIEALDKEIEDTENYLNAVLTSEYSSESEKALAASQLGSGSTFNTLMEMKEEILENVRNGNLDGIENSLEGIGTLAIKQPGSTMGVLEDIYEELLSQEFMGNGSSKLDELKSQVEDLATNQINDLRKELSQDMLAELISMFVNENMDEGLEDGLTADEIMENMKDEQKAEILAGLGMYAQQSYEKGVKDFLSLHSRNAFHDGNKYVYEQLKNESFEFVPTNKLSQVIGYRYIFNDSQKEVTLQRGDRYYKFQAFHTSVKKGNDFEEMTRAAGFQGVVYIPEDITKEYFQVTAEYLKNTSYGVMLTDDMRQSAEEFLDYLLEAGGDF